MGCVCDQKSGAEMGTITEALTDSARYGAYSLKANPDHIIIYDFQTGEFRIVKLSLHPALDLYSVHIHYPLIFIAGGVEREGNAVSKALWSSSAGGEVVEMSERKEMSAGRISPFLVSLRESTIYIVGGRDENRELRKECEKFEIGDATVRKMPSMNNANDYVVGLGKSIYAFGVSGARNQIEFFDGVYESLGWNVIVLDSSLIINLDDFGVLAKNEFERQIILFGGREEERLSKKVFLLDRNHGIVSKADEYLPKEEEFLLPTTSGKQLGFAISKSFEIFKYEKKSERWAVYDTGIVDEVKAKNLKPEL